MLRRPLSAALAAAVLFAAPLGGSAAVAAPAPTADPGPVSVLDTLPLPNFDRLDPSPHPVALTAAPRPLNVSYTYNGQTRTLDDFLNRTTQGFVVLDGDKIVKEWYAPGYSQDSLFQSWSMAKSFTSVAIGIAIGEGKIHSIDDTVGQYIPELAKSAYGDITVRNLLRMASGIAWTEAIDDIPMHVLVSLGLTTTRDWASGRTKAVEQGTTFNYTSMNTAVLALILARATGMPYYKYVQQKLWNPGGMASTAFVGNDSHGNALGYCCYYARDRDFARFGKLMLDGGSVGGVQVVPHDWVTLSATPAGNTPTYGLSWWLDGDDAFYADGLGGQDIYVSRKYNVVVVKSTFLNLDTAEDVPAYRAVAAEVARTR
ncbi:serine hydrolase domain-containing protein [Actinomadura atramentaria]|uniref:serine hydrolase domain-containing protein n=1 Tax=Actinomadura atramentaria TaxID=1990 RepID=UPI000367E50B|nr:serine hydrolase [Actinomadura atramentaria]